jgi:hypothetical protein
MGARIFAERVTVTPGRPFFSVSVTFPYIDPVWTWAERDRLRSSTHKTIRLFFTFSPSTEWFVSKCLE